MFFPFWKEILGFEFEFRKARVQNFFFVKNNINNESFFIMNYFFFESVS